MAKESGQKFIKRNRPPRVHITYLNPEGEEKVEIPFIMGVMADLSGNTPGIEKAEVGLRTFVDIDMDNFDDRMGKMIQPGASFRVENKLAEEPGEKMGVQLRFNKMADFEPAAVARQVPALAKLLKAREQLANLQRYMDGKAGAEKQLRKLLADPQLMQALKDRAVESKSETEGEDEAGA
jgi:type VI secretion system protein ImpB